MESKGYRLYRVSMRGNIFYFTKGESRNVKYFTDFASTIDKEYFRTYIRLGWKPMYNTRILGGKIVIWMKRCRDKNLYSLEDFISNKNIFIIKILKSIILNGIFASVLMYFLINIIFKAEYKYLTFNYSFLVFLCLALVTLITCVCGLIGSISYLLKIKKS
ncbi:DUF2812 domain-containing protein [Clostridium sp. YIM B02505]|uniref:DUF2812 domain-containing protein n=2 Tax=Clostridium yunnanense TaxID=2800325 RepID=A0ABS1EVF1_9CLOT|nr:DUF2812 domain-containing protein [Clostridium yunnanense]